MISFKEITKNEKKDNINKYICSQCKKLKYNKVWSHYNNENIECKFCSYLCDKNYFKTHNSLWDYLVNKEDFNTLFPILYVKPKNPEFVFLSNDVINGMDDNEYNLYNELKEEYCAFNPLRAEIQQSIIDEDDYINKLVNSNSLSDEELKNLTEDDY
jgi:hypothetical protein